MIMKKIYIDTETTGTCNQSGIHQLAAIKEIDGKIVDEHVWHINPDRGCRIEQAALDVSDVSLGQLCDYQPEAEFKRDFQSWLASDVDKFNSKDKYFFVAYNAQFDSERVRDLFKRQGDNYYGSWFWTPADCVMMRAGHFLQSVRHELPNFKLGTVMQFLDLGWDEEEGHDALYDIRKTMQLDQHLIENFQRIIV